MPGKSKGAPSWRPSGVTDMIAALQSEDNRLKAGLSRGQIDVATWRRTPLASSDAFESALSLHRQGRLREAEMHYRKVLKGTPEHVDALHHLGVVKAQQGQPTFRLP